MRAKHAKRSVVLSSVSVRSCASIAGAHDERTANTTCLLVLIGLKARLLLRFSFVGLSMLLQCPRIENKETKVDVRR